MEDDARDRFRGKAPKRGVGALKILDVYAKGGAVRMQEGGPLSQFSTPKRGVSSLPGYGQGADEPAAQVALGARRNIGEFGRALVGAKPYDETNPTGTYRTVQALLNMPTPAAIIPEAAQAAGKAAGALSGLGALGVIKPKGGNWLAGSIERRLEPLKQQLFPGFLPPGADERAIAAANTAESRSKAINNWIDTKLGKYIKNEMATPEDPVRALAERGVLHVDPETLGQYSHKHIAYEREIAGFPAEGMSRSPSARRWEGVADQEMTSDTAGGLIDPDQYGRQVVNMVLKDNPWLAKIDPETPVYGVDDITYSGYFGHEDTGFQHLVDELSNATNPNSGLPRSLQLSPDKLKNVTVPQAVELVDKINKWRAEQKVAADLKRSQNAATVEYKTYDTVPGTTAPNERGLRWVELRAPSNETMPLEERKALIAKLREEGGNPETWPREQLESALKYEGETMGHCVGGYCPDVESGRSRIYSLRDKKGEPHVTIEVEPEPNIGFRQGEGPKTQEERFDLQTQWMKETESGKIPNNITFATWWRSKNNIPEPERKLQISQIKGKANKAPKDEYLPFVQEFVKSGNWSKVQDLQNIGLIEVNPASPLAKNLKTFGREVPRFVNYEELSQLSEEFPSYKKGGTVKPKTSNLRIPLTQDRDVMLLELMRAK